MNIKRIAIQSKGLYDVEAWNTGLIICGSGALLLIGSILS